jgi:hypothetical protein
MKKYIKDPVISFFLGVFVSVVVGGLFYILSIKSPEISYNITSNEKLIEINQPIKGLEIKYYDKSLGSMDKTVSLISFEVQNSGNSTINKSDFLSELPLGFKVINGQVIDQPNMQYFDKKYLAETVKLKLSEPNTYLFNKFTIDKGDSFKIKLLILHKISLKPKIEAIGKISGQNEVILDKVTRMSSRPC